MNEPEPYPMETSISPERGQKRALIGFSLGPVQSFIASARSVRDLTIGSRLLSLLVRTAIDSVRRSDGQLIFPTVKTGALPNRFVAVVDADKAAEITVSCREAVRDCWKHLADDVRTKIDTPLRAVLAEMGISPDGWDRRWDAQIDSFFSVSVAVLPLDTCDDSHLESLLSTGQKSRSQWSRQFELLLRLMGAVRTVRHIPNYRADGRAPGKCTLLGTYEQMGPATLTESTEFWRRLQGVAANGESRNEVRRHRLHIGSIEIRSGERLCAVSLVKRFAPAVRENEFRKSFDDTATLAARCWLKKAKDKSLITGWTSSSNGQWLHWTTRNQDKHEQPCPEKLWEQIQAAKRELGKPPTYYAIVMMDGDRIGSKLTECGSAQELRDLSEAMGEFATKDVRQIVPDAAGELIYAGGDDVLALVPVESVLTCVEKLQQAFRDVVASIVPTAHGEGATISAGIAVVHYKDDLRFALGAARGAENSAKDCGRNRLALQLCRRSGEHSKHVLPWQLVGQLKELQNAFLKTDGHEAASDRWAYRLANLFSHLTDPKSRDAVEPSSSDSETTEADSTWEGLPQALIRQALHRAERSTRKTIGGGQSDQAADKIIQLFEDCREDSKNQQNGMSLPEIALETVRLCQAASFLARGRDQ